MIRIRIERIPKLKSKIENHFLLLAESVPEDNPYNRYAECLFYRTDFYLDFLDKTQRPLKYFGFATSRSAERNEFPEVKDPTTKTALDLLYKDFSTEALFRDLRYLIFKDITLSSRFYFITKKDFLKFSVDLLDKVDEQTSKDLEKARKFILNANFLYLLS
jgi:hypothetical protein